MARPHPEPGPQLGSRSGTLGEHRAPVTLGGSLDPLRRGTGKPPISLQVLSARRPDPSLGQLRQCPSKGPLSRPGCLHDAPPQVG